MSHSPSELLHGTLDLLILKAVADQPRHGYEIVRHITAATGGAIAIEDGSLYPALYRLEKKRLVKGAWGVATGRRARFYQLTERGRGALAAMTGDWTRFAAGVSRLLRGEESS
jgi:transcriptional regulator